MVEKKRETCHHLTMMKDLLLLEVKAFLENHHHPGKPLLFGFSGGSDSLALLHLLHACRRFCNFDLIVAHIDHRWRPASGEEAAALRKHVESLGFPFHLHTLKPSSSKSNMEDRAREARLAYFSHLYEELGCQALVLAHHRDDHAETVLKRLFEGASLHKLGAMAPLSTLRGMTVWRPLLRRPKKDLIQWIESRGLRYINDVTNNDPKFLRGKMRSTLIPTLSQIFGKEIAAPLCQIGAASNELNSYLTRKVEPILKLVIHTGEIWTLDLRPYLPMEALELKTVLYHIAKKVQVDFSAEALSTLCKLLNAKAHQKRVEVSGVSFEAHVGVLKINLKEHKSLIC